MRRRYEHFDARRRPCRGRAGGVALVCRCAGAYPPRLRALPDPPAVLHVARRPGARSASPTAVAIVGARRATGYGLEVSRALGRGLSLAGVPVVSGLALGVDCRGAPGRARGQRPRRSPSWPRRPRSPTRRATARCTRLSAERGAVVSELPPGVSAYRWCFVARNRIVAALARVVVIVEATERSGSLTTADFAADLGCTVAAVPGPRHHAAPPRARTALIQSRRGAGARRADVLDLLADATGEPRRDARAPRAAAARRPSCGACSTAVEAGSGALGELASGSEDARAVLAGLGELEVRGLVRRTFGGRYEPAAR